MWMSEEECQEESRSIQDETIAAAIRILEARLKREKTKMNSTKSVRDFLRLRLGEEEREIFACVWLDVQNYLIEYEVMSLGTLTGAHVYPREVLKSAMRHNAGAVVLAHNHPSGVTEASTSDKMLTNDIVDVLKNVNVKVLDHIIVAGAATLSFAECGML